MNSAGTAAIWKKPKVLTPTVRFGIEGPTLIRHNNKVWMFTSRKDWADCSYFTDAWSSSNGIGGRFTRVRDIVMSAGGDGVSKPCGPGGAQVGRAGNYVAYHVWTGGTHKTGGKRVAHVARLGWRSDGLPKITD